MCSIIIENISAIDLDNEFLLRIVKQSNLPTGKLLLILSNNGLGNRYGACIPRCTLKYTASGSVFRSFKERSWDVSVALSKDVCAEQAIYPAFFTCLLGHELGHAYTCLTDLELHILTCLIDMFIRGASDDAVTMCHQTPHEKRYDQFGINIASQAFTRDKLNTEIEELLKDTIREDHTRLKDMLSLQATQSLINLRQESIAFIRPYKEKFLQLCKQHIIQTNAHSIASELRNLPNLLE
jgi:hypothetical protein